MARRSILDEVLEPHERQIETQLQTNRGTSESLADFIPRISPKFEKPLHLQPLLNVLEEIRAGKQKFVLVSVPPRHSKPLHEDTLVTMGDGTQRRIADLKIDDCVVSGAGRLTTVTGVHDQGVLPVRRLNLRSGTTVVAEETHRFLSEHGWLRVNEIATGDDALAFLHDGAVGYDTVVGIEEAGQAHCWCITVADDSSFLVNGGIITHNSETVLHSIPWLLLAHPEWSIAYASYSSKLALFQSSKARNYARMAGVEVSKDADAKGEWRTAKRGGVVAGGVGSPYTGYGFQVFFCDDPHKDRASAESAIKREALSEWFQSAALTRLEPGASMVILHTRWSTADLIGKQLSGGDLDWEYICLPAIAEENDPTGRAEGTALWPSRWSLHDLGKIKSKVGEYEWASLYQCRPKPRGGSVFNGVTLYAVPELPTDSFKIAIGCDLAYSAKTSSDYAAAVVMMLHKGIYYVLKVIRMHAATPQFRSVLRGLRREYPSARIGGYVASVEAGSLDLMNATDDDSQPWNDDGPRGRPNEVKRYAGPSLNFQIDITRSDKFVRAQPVAAAWNAGKILLPNPCISPEGDRYGIDDDDGGIPAQYQWIDIFQKEVLAFTGVNDPHDDQVDAMAWAYDALGGADFTIEVSGERTSFDKYAAGSITKTVERESDKIPDAFKPMAPDGWMPQGMESMFERKGRGF